MGMTLKEITDSAAGLGNQIKAGIPLAEVTAHLADIQPAYAEFWEETAVTVRDGKPLSTSMVQVWPNELVKALEAGEHASKMEAVLDQIRETIALRLRISAKVQDLTYPLSMILVGLMVFLGFMIFTVPKISKAFGTLRQDPLAEAIGTFSLLIQGVFREYWMIILIGLAVGAVALYRWLQLESTRKQLLDMFLDFPYVGPALTTLYLALWCRYMATQFSAGISTIDSLRITAEILPEKLASGVRLFADDLAIHNKPMGVAVSRKNWAEDDPRHRWPNYITHAFGVYERSGLLDEELLRVAPSMIEDGEIMMTRAIAFAKTVSYLLAGAAIGASAFIYYIPIFSAASIA